MNYWESHGILRPSRLFFSFLSIVFLIQMKGYALEYSEDSLLTALQQSDKEYLTEFTLKCKVVSPGNQYFDTLDTHVRDLTITASGGSLATSSTILRYLYSEKAIQKKKQKTEAPDMYFGRVKHLSLQEPDFIGIWDSPCLCKIGKDGSFTPENPKHLDYGSLLIAKPAPNHSHQITDDTLGILTMGRGFSNYLEKVSSIKKISASMIEIQASGHAFTMQCHWKLMIDTDAGLLVRSAMASSIKNNDFCFLMIRNEGAQVIDNVKLPTNGIYSELCALNKVNDDEKKHEVTFLDYKRQAQLSLLTEIKQKLRGELPRGIEVSDFRDGDGSTCKTYIVGDEKGPFRKCVKKHDPGSK